MTTRRRFLAGLAASAFSAVPGWAAAGGPDFLAAARMGDGSFALIGLRRDGTDAFRIPLPGRGHAAAAHPHRAIAVAFARRPGTFALVIDCAAGRTLARLQSPSGRHFYGHGVFSGDGTRLFTTENDYEAARGVVGIWDTRDFTRIGEFSSSGTGPHDIARLPDDTLVVANGGIETHPDAGRAKLNIPTMRPNLAYLSQTGAVRETVELSPDWHRDSIRHLALAADGTVAFGMQWQGDAGIAAPLVGLHRRGGAPRLMAIPDDVLRVLRGYVGSIAFDPAGKQVAITAPRGNRVVLFDARTSLMTAAYPSTDVGGISALAGTFVATGGTGAVQRLTKGRLAELAGYGWNWDNHLVGIGRT